MKLQEILELLFEGAREDFVVKQYGQQLVNVVKSKERVDLSAENIVEQLKKSRPIEKSNVLAVDCKNVRE